MTEIVIYDNTETLHCRAGHDFTRQAVQGRKPVWCPEHRPTPSRRAAKPAEERTEAPKAPSGPSAIRVADIKARLEAHSECHCNIDPYMTDDQLMYEVKSCCYGWQCGVLTAIRDKWVDLNRHQPKLELV